MKSETVDPVPSTRCRRRWRWLGYLIIALLLMAGIVIGLFVEYMNAFFRGFEPAEMAAVHYRQKTLRANLGGMLVAIPWYFAEYVEYDGDPGFGEKHKGPRPVRTPESKVRSFGFDMRYPDMRGLEIWAMRSERSRRYTPANIPWISVGMTSGEDYPGDGFMDRRAYASLEAVPSNDHPMFLYSRLPNKQHGLEVYAQLTIDERTSRPYREDSDAEDVFVYRDQDGHVKSYIRCSNRKYVPGTKRKLSAPPCEHEFSLEPRADVEVYVHYRRQLLHQWQNIEMKVRQRILSFEILPGETESLASLEAERHRMEREKHQQQTQPAQ